MNQKYSITGLAAKTSQSFSLFENFLKAISLARTQGENDE
jgi:hypothetical protein